MSRKKSKKNSRARDCADCGCDGLDLFSLLSVLSLANLALLLGALPRLALESGRGARRSRTIAGALTGGIRGYQLHLSAHLPARCNLSPTCSLAIASRISTHGALEGVRWGRARLHACAAASSCAEGAL